MGAWLRAFLALGLLCVVAALSGGVRTAVSAACDPPIANPIVCENSWPGNPPSEWDVSGAGDPNIQGFATDFSVNLGETVEFKVATNASDYRIDIYRLGYYGGLGARKIATVQPSAALPQFQPACLKDGASGLVDCGNWSLSASWLVPASAVSGIYIGKLVREDGAVGSSHIIFVVRDDNGHSPLLFQTSDTTWQAYNAFGGSSLYTGPSGRGYKVSYNRPFTTRQSSCCAGSTESFLSSAEYPMVRWLERNGYNVSYFSGIDSDRRGAEILEHEVFISVGHDEYWSAAQRSNVEGARDAGVNLAFFSGNEVFWKTRWETSIDGSNTPYRTLVSYKETHDAAKIDPSEDWTGTWRDPRFSPPSDGGRPENALTGNLFMVNGPRNDPIEVPAAEGKLRFWRNTDVATLPPDGVATLPAGVLGFEWDEDRDNGQRPPGLLRLSKTTLSVSSYLLDYGSTFAGGTATHRLTLYRDSSGALVFGAGTVQWSWGLDTTHDVAPQYTAPTVPDSRMQQATVNLLADMGVQPGTLQPGLVQASASSDSSPPAAQILSPTAGSTINGQAVISGTAVDAGGGVVGGVEVSLDDGQTWHPADGRENWSFTWNPGSIGDFVLRARAIDDSGNIGPRSAPVSVTTSAAVVAFDDLIGGRPLAGQYPAGQIDWGNGQWFVSPPIGAFTTASVSFVEGLTQASFSFVVPRRFLSIQAFNSGPSPSTVTITCEGNPDKSSLVPAGEVMTINTGWLAGCQTPTISSSNGWDTNFDNLLYDDAGIPPDVTPPVISGVQASVNGTRATLTWLTDEHADTQVEYGPTTAYGLTTPLDGSFVAAHSATLAGLTLGATYHYRVKSRDAWGNLAVSGDFTVTASCPCSFWDGSAQPAVASAPDTAPVELGVKFSTSVAGYVSGIRFYKGPTNTGTHTVHLWSASGQLLASAAATNESASGWQQASFPAPVALQANTTYVASYFAPAGGFSYTRPFFTTALNASPLQAPADAPGGGNGVFNWGASGFPSQTYQSSNYWVDVVFNTVPVDEVPPVLVSHTPADSASDVSPGAPLLAVFSEPVNAGSLAFVLRGPGNSQVPASMSYDAATRTATLQPQALLALTTSYTATVSGALDAAGNSMAPVTWSFVTAAAASSIWSADAMPAVASQADSGAVELGVKFRSAISGYARGVRFYKGPANTGVHTGSLWSVDGQLLARATFANETATGWQEVLFSAPVELEANTTYIVSYHAPVGGYALNQHFFDAGAAERWPLTALEEGVDGPNGVFRYGPSSFPNQSYAASNYWVDVLFSPNFLDNVPPAVAGHTPAAGATKVPPGTNVQATFSEPVQPATISFVLRTAQGAAVTSSVSYDASTRVVTLDPASDLPLGGTFTATLSGAQDASGNTMSSYGWTFSTPACPCSLWEASATPGTAAQGDSASLELGVKFRSDITGYVTGIRFYKGAGNSGTHVGNLWTESGALLATAVFSNESGSGWQQVTFPAPIAIQANTTYVASYFAPNGHYALDAGYFVSELAAWPLRAPAGGNGLYRYSSTSAFPSSSYNESNYWVDVVFTTSPSDSVPPSLVSRSPLPDANDVPADVSIIATFNEAIDEDTLTLTLRDSGNVQVSGSLIYDEATRKATMAPSADLELGETYTVTLGARDIAGNQMAPVSWSFTTHVCPCSLWSPSAVPAVASQPDSQAIEVGLKFRSEVAGSITGIRFYKGPANTGTHVAHLWTASGQLLASATFTGESSSGWQQVNFSAPVVIQADTTYVASYHAANGGYSRTVDYFDTALAVYPLLAPASGNGVFAYGPSGTFPTSSFAASNYWVDVVFATGQ